VKGVKVTPTRTMVRQRGFLSFRLFHGSVSLVLMLVFLLCGLAYVYLGPIADGSGRLVPAYRVDEALLGNALSPDGRE
jgi:hypothetical protein